MACPGWGVGYLRALGAWLPQEFDGAGAVGALAAAVVPGQAAARVALQAVAQVFGRHRVLQEAAAEAEVSRGGSGGCRGKGGERRPWCPSHPMPPKVPFLPHWMC